MLECGGGSTQQIEHRRPRRLPTLGLHEKLARMLLARLHLGRLTVVTPGGQTLVQRALGPGPEAIIHLRRWRTVRRLILQGDVGFADSYIDGDWSSPDIAALIELAARNDETFGESIDGSLPIRFLNRLLHWRRANTPTGSRRNIMAHYDLGNTFFKHWLDRGMNYSSALFTAPDETLESAQDAKQALVLEQLALGGGERVLEVGCGWGGLAARLTEGGCHVTGLTLSPAQRAYAQTQLAAAGLSDRADLRLQDYRDVTGSFDRIVSIEMFEAVGQRYWPAYFAMLRDRLAAKGTAVLQIITIDDSRFASYARTPDFIQRYIFPGGMLPSATALREQIAAAGLAVVAQTNFGQSYARTLAEWNRRFQRAWPAIEALGFDVSFKRMWEYYLAYCEGGFRSGATDVGLYCLKAR